MTPIIDIYAVTVADFLGVAILLVILVSRGWNLPGRKEESHILLRMLIMSVINCVVDLLVAFYDGKLGAGFQFYRMVLLIGNTYLYLYNTLVGIFLVHMVVKHIDSKTSHRKFIVFWIACFIQIVLLIINLFTPIVFKIDMNN